MAVVRLPGLPVCQGLLDRLLCQVRPDVGWFSGRQESSKSNKVVALASARRGLNRRAADGQVGGTVTKRSYIHSSSLSSAANGL